MYKYPVSALVVIHDADHWVLLLERAQAPGFWQSVTGSLEIDETPFQAALREAREETGLAIAPESLKDWRQQNRYEIYARWRHRYAPGVTHNTEHVFSACVATFTPVLSPEHSSFMWLPQQEAALKVFSPSNRAAIEALV